MFANPLGITLENELLLAIAALLLAIYTYRKLTVSQRCPVCGKASIERLPRPLLLRTIFPFFIKGAYRCLNCHHRFYSATKQSAHY